jgi:nucleoid-associated protein Lsr2
MAQKVQVLLVDDLDGSEATETVTFGLDGVAYEIDLSSGNAGRALAPAASRVRESASGRRPTATRSMSVAAFPRTSSPSTKPFISSVDGRLPGVSWSLPPDQPAHLR